MIEYILISILALLNVFAFLYCRFLLKNIVSLSEGAKDIRTLIVGFKEHVNSIYELEMFYGDDTLKALIEHSNFVLERIKEYEESLELTEQETQEDELVEATDGKN
jgi:hypothetical protein